MNWLSYAREVVRQVPAYKKFLAQKKISLARIKKLEDLPVIDKKSYIQKFSFKDRVPEKKIPPFIYASSGSSGVPTFWFRSDDDEDEGARLHEVLFHEVFGIQPKDSTLVIICFSMGIWVAGNFTLECVRTLSRKGWALTAVTPGIEREDILHTLQTLGPHFKNVILAGYPPFLMDVAFLCAKRGIVLPNHLKILTAGDAMSEEFRERLVHAFGIARLHDVISLYGCADAGVLGFETKETIALRQKAVKNKKLYKMLFGEPDASQKMPALFAYDSSHVCFEERAGELLFTIKSAMPLIRYNIHDLGSLLKISGIKWPCVVKRGRSDVAVTFYALNIYPEHVTGAFTHPKISHAVSGQFFAYTKEGKGDKSEELHVAIELNPRTTGSRKLAERITRALFEHLHKVNVEYRKLHSVLGIHALPRVKLAPFGKLNLARRRGILALTGKKPRIVLPHA